MKFCIVTNWRMVYTKMALIFQNSYATPLIRLSLRIIGSLVTTYQIYMKFCIVTNWRLTALIFSCLVSGAYLFCDLVYSLVGSTRRTSFYYISSPLLGRTYFQHHARR